jgi:MOSC domain-containing protein YiiM
MKPQVNAIFTTPLAGAPLVVVHEAQLEAGRGIVGDRYYAQCGTFSEKLKGKPDAELTLIESEEIQRYNALLAKPLAMSEFRRNIVTQDVRLNDLVGRRFRIGQVKLEGIRLCEPCAHLATFAGNEVVERMAHRAGLRARIVTSGVIRPSDVVTF